MNEIEYAKIQEELQLTSSSIQSVLDDLKLTHLVACSVEKEFAQDDFKICAGCGLWRDFVFDEHCEECSFDESNI